MTKTDSTHMDAATGQRNRRIALPTFDMMSPEQQRVYSAVVGGRRGKVIGPLKAAIHSPLLAERWANLGEYLRYNTILPERIVELAITVTARRWTSQVEWWVHARRARECGIPQQALDAIRDGETPVFDAADDLTVYEYSRQIHELGSPEQDLYEAAWRSWGEQGIVELTAVIGYYTMVAITLNAHEIQPPEEAEAGLSEPADGVRIVSLRPGALAHETGALS